MDDLEARVKRELFLFVAVFAFLLILMATADPSVIVRIAASPFDGVEVRGVYVSARMPSGNTWNARLGWMHEGGYFVALAVAILAARRGWRAGVIACAAGLIALILTDMLVIRIMKGFWPGSMTVWFNLHPYVLPAGATAGVVGWTLGKGLRWTMAPMGVTAFLLEPFQLLMLLTMVFLAGRILGTPEEMKPPRAQRTQRGNSSSEKVLLGVLGVLCGSFF